MVGASVRSYGRSMTSKPLIPLLAVALLAGCGSDRTDRAGGDKPVEAKVLTMANAQYYPDELAAFRDAVERVSGGRLRLKLINQYGTSRDGNPEINVIRDISAGKADLGWAASRIFDELDVRAFNPLHAPMLIDSYELEQRVLSDDIVDPMLDSLGEELGLRGVGVLPGPLRHPFGKRPLRALADWQGASIGSSGGEQVGKALRAVGARREPEFSGDDTSRVDGLDTHVAAVLPNRYQRSIPYLTGNVVLWARPLVVFAGPAASGDDLAVLREAAKSAIPQVLELSASWRATGCRRSAAPASRSSRPRRPRSRRCAQRSSRCTPTSSVTPPRAGRSRGSSNSHGRAAAWTPCAARTPPPRRPGRFPSAPTEP